MTNLLDDCKADAECNQAYPNLEERFNALLEELSVNPLPLPVETTEDAAAEDAPSELTVDLLGQQLTHLINGNPSAPAYVPLIIHDLEQGDVTTFEQAVSGELLAAAEAAKSEVSVAETSLREARDFTIEVNKLLQAEALSDQQQRPSTVWFNQAMELVNGLPEAEQPRAITNLYGAGYRTEVPRDRGTLKLTVTENFSEKTAAPLITDLDAMPKAEIRSIYELISESLDSASPVDAGSTQAMHHSFDCREHLSWSTQADIDAIYASSRLPRLAQVLYKSYPDIVAMCNLWPAEPADPSERQVLERDIPTLVLQGRYDTATSTDRGQQAMAGLSNSFYVEFPRLGYGVGFKGPCGLDIGVAFINQPRIRPDTSCTAALEPDFVTPSEVAPMPVSAAPVPSGPTTYTTVVDDSTLLIEISDGEGFYFREPLTQQVEGGDDAGLNDWVQVLLNPATGRVQVVQIGTGEVLFDYRLAL